MTNRIFIIDDKADIVRLLTDMLKEDGYLVQSETDPVAGLKKLQDAPADLLILDIRMEGMDGLTLCRELKSNPKTAGILIIMLSVKAQESDVIVGLEMGADDYLPKPVRKGILLARVKAVLRRRETEKMPQVIKVGPIEIDMNAYTVTIDGKRLELRPKEFDLLAYFVRNEGRVLTRTNISQHVWGRDHVPTSKTLEFHIHQLRKNLGKYGDWIKSLTGVGYRFESE